MQKFPYERASTILAEAELFSDKEICKKWNISAETLRRYRVKSHEDANLWESVVLKKRMLLNGWQSDVAVTMKATLWELKKIVLRASEFLDEEDPEQGKKFAAVLHAVTGTSKILGELKLAGEALDEPSSGGEVSEAQARSGQTTTR
jgi:hypothetical protein